MMKHIGQYDYQDLYNKAIRPTASKQEVEDLADWFEHFGSEYWNGECYVIDSHSLLYPVYEGEIFQYWEII